MTMTTFIKENIQLGLAYSLKGIVHYNHGKKHRGMQEDIAQSSAYVSVESRKKI